ncbi:hypothetical protein KAU11_11450 [Candidatus Babeliales bacterium]|nr:hypothetical protein [Candidatus Babeliales bacterium]
MEKFECERDKSIEKCQGFCLFVGNDGKFMKCKFLKIIKIHEGDGL